jgi:hypothetical protein
MTLLMTLSWRSLLILLVAERTMYDRSRRSENRKEEQMARAHADMTQPPAPSDPIHVVVDLNRCSRMRE